jgi:hypothetical protein
MSSNYQMMNDKLWSMIDTIFEFFAFFINSINKCFNEKNLN